MGIDDRHNVVLELRFVNGELRTWYLHDVKKDVRDLAAYDDRAAWLVERRPAAQ
jgi:hypothetical protein